MTVLCTYYSRGIVGGSLAYYCISLFNVPSGFWISLFSQFKSRSVSLWVVYLLATCFPLLHRRYSVKSREQWEMKKEKEKRKEKNWLRCGFQSIISHFSGYSLMLIKLRVSILYGLVRLFFLYPQHWVSQHKYMPLVIKTDWDQEKVWVKQIH